MSILFAALVGSLTGLHAATWGAFKDSPFEGFRMASYLRSILVGTAGAVTLAATTRLESTQFPVVLIGLVYAAERLATEWWKSFVREDEQDAYAIPMRMAVQGRPVDARLPRYALGLCVVLGLVLTCWAAAALQPTRPAPIWQSVLVGGVGGWLTAVGGAWKDAPIEGFSGWKFLRSPVVATAWTLALLPFTDDWLLLAVAAGGLSVASIETYKTFLTGGRPPGKFLGKPVRWSHRTARERCRFLHSGLYVVFACCFAGALLVNDRGTDTVRAAGQSLALLTMVVFASNVALLVAVAVTPTPTSDGGFRPGAGVTAERRAPRFAMLASSNSKPLRRER
jgi:hypothetical protein